MEHLVSDERVNLKKMLLQKFKKKERKRGRVGETEGGRQYYYILGIVSMNYVDSIFVSRSNKIFKKGFHHCSKILDTDY